MLPRVFVAAAVLAVCGATVVSNVTSQSFPISGTSVTLVWKNSGDGCPYLGLVRDSSPVALWETVPCVPFLGIGQSLVLSPPVSSQGGFTLLETMVWRSDNQTVTFIATRGAAVLVSGAVGQAVYTLTFVAGLTSAQVNASASVSQLPSVANRVFLTHASDAKEGIVGFGTQYSQWNMKGRVVGAASLCVYVCACVWRACITAHRVRGCVDARCVQVPVIVSEQGVGRGLEPITFVLNTFGEGSGGYWFTTYVAVPNYVTTNQRGLLLDGGGYSSASVFDLTNDSTVDVAMWVPSDAGAVTLTAVLFDVPAPSDYIREVTLHTGRMAPLPDWTQTGVVIGFEGGTDAVRNMTQLLRRHNVTVAGMWLQDWSGVAVTPTGTRLWWNWEVRRALCVFAWVCPRECEGVSVSASVLASVSASLSVSVECVSE